MSHRRSRSATAAVLLVCCAIAAGCGGSSASTSGADAAAVAAAEHGFLRAWNGAETKAKEQCQPAAGKSFYRCYNPAVRPGQRAAVASFTDALEKVMAGGVGSKCAEAVEEAIAEPEALPNFPGDATAGCRAESRQQ
jgi:hypothetical protein